MSANHNSTCQRSDFLGRLVDALVPSTTGSIVLLAVALCANIATISANGQDVAFRESRTYVGVGLGVYTFHGPVDLWKPRSDANFVRKKDPAFLGNVTFPLTENRLSMRGQIGYTSSDRQFGTRLLISGENEFIVNDLVWFESDLVVHLRSPKRRIIPYLFGGIGFLLADPFNRTNAHRESIPTAHVKRTQFYFPVGVGVDVAMTRRLSLYLESGMRLSRNSVFLDRAEPDPFNSTLLLGGVRLAVGRRPVPPIELVPLCPICPLPPVGYQSPLAAIGVMETDCCACAIQDLQSISFATGSASLDAAATKRLNENIVAIELSENQDCELIVSGFYDQSESEHIAGRRAAIVAGYYFDAGLGRDRVRLGSPLLGDAECSGKKDAGTGNRCSVNQRVETLPFCAFGPTCPAPYPPPRYSPLQDY